MSRHTARVRFRFLSALNARGLARAEANRGRVVRIHFGRGRRVTLAASTWVALWGLQHRARLIVVERERSQPGGWSIWR